MTKSGLSLFSIFFFFICRINSSVGLPNNPVFTDNQDTTGTSHKINGHFIVHAKKASDHIKIDGLLNEKAWSEAEGVSRFYMVLPYDTGFCKKKTYVRVTYDKKALYASAVFYDSVPGKRPVESLRRDWNFVNNDNFMVVLDPYNDQTTGYTFAVNAAGAQRDGSISEGRTNNLVWDCKWESKVINYPDHWISEFRIPFKSIRYKAGVDHWSINFSRNDMKTNEKSSWAPMPRQFPTASLAYTGQLLWENAPQKSGLKFSIIPYLFSGASQNKETSENVKYKHNFGFDAKLGLSTSLNLDLTYNPDFSQAELDDQVTNLSRFELYYPEKRQFFLENMDLFADFGAADVRPFFSRRIGLDAPVDLGARLSGKLGKDWRIGIMDMQTGKEGEFLARNFFVSTVEKKVFARSNFGFIFVNKEQLNLPHSWSGNSYNRIAGAEYNLASRDNFWTGKLFGLRSFTPAVHSSDQFSQGLELVYSRKKTLLEFKEYYVAKDFNAETGYVPRKDFYRINPQATFKFYPKSGRIEYHGLLTGVDNFYMIGENRLTDRQIRGDYFFRFKDMSQIDLKNNYWYIRLRNDFDPTNRKINFLKSGTSYKWLETSLCYTSDSRKPFKYIIGAGYGGYFNGNKISALANINYRFQPYGFISLIVNYNDLFLPAPWTRTSYWLIAPKLDVTFTENLFFTSYVQYNQQTDNLNINTRFQWRYKPVSDFFIVYTNNYFAGRLDQKNWALVLKVSYWLN